MTLKSGVSCKTDLGTIFSMLGEAATAAIACRHNDQGLDGCGITARKGRRIAEEARERLEQETGEGKMIFQHPKGDNFNEENK